MEAELRTVENVTCGGRAFRLLLVGALWALAFAHLLAALWLWRPDAGEELEAEDGVTWSELEGRAA